MKEELNVAKRKLATQETLSREQPLSNRAFLESTLPEVGEAINRAGMCVGRHQASDAEIATLRAEMHKIDLKVQELRCLARKVDSQHNSAPSPNHEQGDSNSRLPELTNSLREAELAKAISGGKEATVSALARKLQSVNQFLISKVRELSRMHAPAPGAGYYRRIRSHKTISRETL